MPSPTPDASPTRPENRQADPADPASGTDPARTAGGVPARLWYLVAGLVLALVVGGLWLAGGFERRTDVVTDTPVGTLVTCGPYELRFTEATVQQRTAFDGEVRWRVELVGEGRTTGAETTSPRTGDGGMFVARDPGSSEVQVADTVTYRPGQAQFGGGFTPGLPAQPFTVRFEFSDTYRPGPTVVVGVFELELRDNSLLGGSEPQWLNSPQAYRFTVPLRELPAQVS